MKQRGRDRKEVKRDLVAMHDRLTKTVPQADALRRFRTKPYETVDVMEYIKRIREKNDEKRTEE